MTLFGTPNQRRVSALAAGLACTAMLLAACGRDNAEGLRAKAKAAIEQHDTKTAEIHLKNLLQANDKDADARRMLGDLYLSSYDYRSAEKEYRRALESGGDPQAVVPGLFEALSHTQPAQALLEEAGRYSLSDPKAQAALRFFVAAARQRLGQPAEARADLQAALALDPAMTRAKVALVGLRWGSEPAAAMLAEADQLVASDPASAEALMLQAGLRSAGRNIDGARESLTKAIGLRPNDVTIRSTLVGLELENGRNEQARAELDEIAKRAPAWPPALEQRATLQLRMGANEAARDSIQQALKFAPEYLPVLVTAANVSLSLGSLEQAEQYSRKVIELAPDSSAGPRLLATTLLRKGDAAKALEILQPAVDKDTRDPALLALAGEAALKSSNPKAAATYFDKSLRLDGSATGSRIGLGLAKISTGDHASGLAELSNASRQDSGTTRADYALISTLLNDKQYDKALAAIDDLEKKQPEGALPSLLRGRAWLGKGDQAKARTQFEKAASLSPGSLEAADALAQLDLREGKPERARARFESIVQASPKNWRALMALASVTAFTKGSPDEVLQILQRAREADPSALQPVLALATAYLRQDKASDAVSLLQKSLPLAPENPEMQFQLGLALEKTGQHEQARETMDRLVRQNPTHAAIAFRVGQFQMGINNNDAAIKLFESALAIEPKAFEVRFELARALSAVGRSDESKAASDLADSQLADAIKAAPDNVPLRFIAGDRALSRKQFGPAAQQYEAIHRLVPTNAAALNNLAWSLHQLKDGRDRGFAEQAYRLAPEDAAVTDTLATILFDAKDVPRSMELFRKAIALAPKRPDIRLHYVQALTKAGDAAALRTEAEGLVRDFPGTTFATAASNLLSTLK